MRNFDIVEVQKKIGYFFKDWELLFTAFTHSSYANEQGVQSYERLEFLGDSIINFIVAEYLFDAYRTESEGYLTKMRANLVSTRTLSAATDRLDLIKYLKTSGGTIQDEVRKSQAVKADLFEAITGAIMVDGGGIDACKKFVLESLADFIHSEYAAKNGDYKSLLYETCARCGKKLEFDTKPAPEGGFVSVVSIDGNVVCRGAGSSKKRAEQDAAEGYFSGLQDE